MTDTQTFGGAAAFFGNLGVAFALGFASNTFMHFSNIN